VTEPATNTALLLMDFQGAMVDAVRDGQDLTKRAAVAAAQARAANSPVVHIRVAFTQQDYAGVSSRNKRFSELAANEYLADGSEHAAIVPALKPEPTDIVLTKTRVGAFSTTNLDLHLRSRGIDTLILTGISTAGVVLTTVREAADRDYKIVVLADLCADPDEAVHDFLIERVIAPQVHLATLEELPNILEGIA
jgi:nicotinamidase-related amidase